MSSWRSTRIIWGILNLTLCPCVSKQVSHRSLVTIEVLTAVYSKCPLQNAGVWEFSLVTQIQIPGDISAFLQCDIHLDGSPIGLA